MCTSKYILNFKFCTSMTQHSGCQGHLSLKAIWKHGGEFPTVPMFEECNCHSLSECYGFCAFWIAQDSPVWGIIGAWPVWLLKVPQDISVCGKPAYNYLSLKPNSIFYTKTDYLGSSWTRHWIFLDCNHHASGRKIVLCFAGNLTRLVSHFRKVCHWQQCCLGHWSCQCGTRTSWHFQLLRSQCFCTQVRTSDFFIPSSKPVMSELPHGEMCSILWQVPILLLLLKITTMALCWLCKTLCKGNICYLWFQSQGRKVGVIKYLLWKEVLGWTRFRSLILIEACQDRTSLRCA